MNRQQGNPHSSNACIRVRRELEKEKDEERERNGSTKGKRQNETKQNQKHGNDGQIELGQSVRREGKEEERSVPENTYALGKRM